MQWQMGNGGPIIVKIWSSAGALGWWRKELCFLLRLRSTVVAYRFLLCPVSRYRCSGVPEILLQAHDLWSLNGVKQSQFVPTAPGHDSPTRMDTFIGPIQESG